MIEGFGDGFFDEAFFEADAQLASGDLDEVFGFEGGEPLERVREKSLFGSWTALLREGGIHVCDLRKGKRLPHEAMAEDFFRAGAEIAVMTKDWSELGGILLCDFGDRAEENREANRENAFLAPGENAAAEEEGRDGGLIDRCGAEILGDQADFFVLFGSGSDGFAELDEAEHKGRPVSHGDERGLWERKIGLA